MTDNLKKLYEILQKKGFLKKGQIDQVKIEKAKLSDLFETAHSINEITSISNLTKNISSFSYSASFSLSGDSAPCNHIKCRKKRAYTLGQLAIMLSDVVYIRNYLSNFDDQFCQNISEEDLKQKFRDDLEVLNYIRPLIESGFVVPVTPYTVCKDCLYKTIVRQLGTSADNNFQKIATDLLNKYRKDISVTAEYFQGHYVLNVKGPDYLIDHGGAYLIQKEENANELNKHRDIVKKIKNGQSVELSSKIRQELNIEPHFAKLILDDIIFEIMVTEELDSSFITDRSIELDILNQLSGRRKLQDNNSLAEKHLSSLLPFIEGATIPDLIKIRKSEEDAFISYRQSLQKAIQEYKQNQKTFTEKDAKILYSQYIQPELASLDRKVKNARQRILKSVTRSGIGFAASLTFGIYSGFLPKDLIGAAAALGIAHHFGSLVESSLSAMDKKEAIKEDNLYFLWKIKELNK